MRTLLGMQYGGNVPQQYPRQQLQPQSFGNASPQQYPRQILPPQQFQEGDTVSSGLAGLRRLGKKREAVDVYGEEQAEQIEKQKRAGLFGSLLGLGSGAGAAWLTPFLFSNPATAALALPWLVGGASGAGKWIGEKAGYGKEQDIDMDMMYAKEAGLGDIERAGEEYQGDMWKRAAVSGIKSGLTAGFAPKAGNIFKRIAGRGAPATAPLTAPLTAGTTLPELGITGGYQPGSFLSGDFGSQLAGYTQPAGTELGGGSLLNLIPGAGQEDIDRMVERMTGKRIRLGY